MVAKTESPPRSLLPLLARACSQAQHLFAGGKSVSVKSVIDSLASALKLVASGVTAHHTLQATYLCAAHSSCDPLLALAQLLRSGVWLRLTEKICDSLCAERLMPCFVRPRHRDVDRARDAIGSRL